MRYHEPSMPAIECSPQVVSSVPRPIGMGFPRPSIAEIL